MPVELAVQNWRPAGEGRFPPALVAREYEFGGQPTLPVRWIVSTQQVEDGPAQWISRATKLKKDNYGSSAHSRWRMALHNG